MSFVFLIPGPLRELAGNRGEVRVRAIGGGFSGNASEWTVGASW